MLTIKDVIDNLVNIDEIKLVQISDKLWKMGSLEDIKANVSPDLFYLHIGINLVGIWKGEGWDGIMKM